MLTNNISNVTITLQGGDLTEQRLKELRKALHLTQQDFAFRLGISRNNIATYEIGKSRPGDAVVALICREFNVNETWLRTGEGEMFAPVDPENQLMEWAGRVLADSSDSFRARFVRMMMGLTDKEWAVLEEKARQLLDEEKDDS